MKAERTDLWDRIYSERTTKAVFFASIVYVMVVASVGWNSMLSELYAFRQTQTAISVSYLLKGGPWLAYETPVLGPPWSIPFEFPLYQWVVALVAKAGLFPVDQAGRFISEFFFFASLFPLFKVLRLLNLSNRQCYLILAIFCISPQYLFWSRTFMIESTALCASIYFLWLVFLCGERLASGRVCWLVLFGVAVLGTLAGLVKVTTFFAFLAAACIVITVYVLRKRQGEKQWKAMLPFFLLFAAAVIIPFLAVLAWTSYADTLKSMNPLAIGLTSDSLKSWNFGTLAQRLSMATWHKFYSITLADLVGNSHLAVISVAALLLCRKERITTVIVSLGLFLLALMTFTNLHYVHTYYSYANGIFLIIALGIIFTDLLECNGILKRASGVTLFFLTIVFCVQHFFAGLWVYQNRSFDFSSITAAVDSNSHENDVFIVIGNSWSSEIPYHIKRRAVMMSPDLSDPNLITLKENLKQYRIGGLLFYTRNGFSKENQMFIYKALDFFDISPGFYSVYPWYKSYSELLIIFNST